MTICIHCGHDPEPKFGLTEEQRILLGYIRSYMAKNKGRAPSYSEMCKAMCEKSKGNMFRLMTALEERGHIARIPHHARAVKLL